MFTEAGDSASIKIDLLGHYLLSFVESSDTDAERLPISYDTNAVFGQYTYLFLPNDLKDNSIDKMISTYESENTRIYYCFATVKMVNLKAGE